MTSKTKITTKEIQLDEGREIEEDWDLILTPTRKWWDFRIKELWDYRDLIVLFVKRDFVATYKQTILGPLWYLIDPIFNTVVFTFIFNTIAGLSTDEIPPFLFYLAGTVVWNYFSGVLITTSKTFIGNEGVFGKVYFPRMTVPVSLVLSGLVKFIIQYLLFLLILYYFIFQDFLIQPNLWILITPLLILLMAGLALGAGIIISALTTKYRDLQGLVPIGTQLMMFLTPIIYPASSVPEEYRSLLFLNPLTSVFEIFRFAYFGSGTLDMNGLVYSVIFMFGLLTIGTALFNRVETTFMDTI